MLRSVQLSLTLNSEWQGNAWTGRLTVWHLPAAAVMSFFWHRGLPVQHALEFLHV